MERQDREGKKINMLQRRNFNIGCDVVYDYHAIGDNATDGYVRGEHFVLEGIGSVIAGAFKGAVNAGRYVGRVFKRASREVDPSKFRHFGF